MSEPGPGRSYLHATDNLGPVSFHLYESESFVTMLQMMNLIKMVIPHYIFNVR